MIVFADTGEEWTFAEVEAYSNRVAHMLTSMGFGKGDVIAVFMPNHPKYVPIVLGLSKIGAVGALINNNVRHEVQKKLIEFVLFYLNSLAIEV